MVLLYKFIQEGTLFADVDLILGGIKTKSRLAAAFINITM